jgi:choline dehydrogenase-like flavoprotein
VVLAAGALGTPQILMRSGIGDAGELAFHGIDVIADRAGVGANLQDHLQIGLRYEVHGTRTLNPLMHSTGAQAAMALQFALTRRGPLTMAPCQLGLFACSSADVGRADLGYNVLAFSRGGALGTAFDPFEGLTMIVYDLRPSSRGRVRLTGRDARLPPGILANYLGTERDCRVAANAIRRTRAIMRQPALQALRPQERWAGALVPDGDEAGLVAAARAVGISIFHPAGTAKMGAANDPAAVVDHQLRVHGIARLRLADASIMPTLVSGNTATPTLMIAEKAAAMITGQPDRC